MAVITQFGTSILSAAEDATPAGASGAATALLTTWDQNKLTSAARVYQAESNSDITWTKILTILNSPPAVSFEEKKITYITDCEYISGNVSQKLIEFAKSSDLLIHDSHFSKEDLPNHKGWGHSSWDQAVDIAKKSNSKQLALFHHNPNYSDLDIQNIENKAQAEFEGVFVAKQGLVIYL